jgi:hypothetical protein
MNTDTYVSIALEIIKGQEQIIGPVAVEQAQKVSGLMLDWGSKSAQFTLDPLVVLDALVEKYKQLFGQISVEVCRDAAMHVAGGVPHDQLPKSLQ